MRFLPRAAFVAALLAPSLALAQTAPLGAVVGDWYGTLTFGSQKLAMVAHIAADGATTLDVPAQMAKGLQATTTLESGKIRIALKIAPAGFEGTLSANGQSLDGAWFQNGQSVPVSWSRTAPIVNRPQTPKPPFPYRSEDLTYRNPASGLTLAGTLTLPQGAGPFPAVVLISGSGTQDRDETIFDHKPFLVIADALTRKGVAVLRVDDRGAGGSQAGAAGGPVMRDIATDVAAGVALLRARADIDPDRVGLIGHSEGGEVAPMAATLDPRIAFLVLLSAPGVPGVKILEAQNRALFAAAGVPADQIDIMMKNRLAQWEAVRTAETPEAAKAQLAAVLDRQGMPADSPQRPQVMALASPVWRDLLNANPAEALAHVKVPVLAIGGDKDLQVDAKTNLAAIKAALPSGGDVTIQTLPGLNHLFQTAKTGAPMEYSQIEETIAPSALAAIVDWTVAHAVKK